jgi:hypothetical protein
MFELKLELIYLKKKGYDRVEKKCNRSNTRGLHGRHIGSTSQKEDQPQLLCLKIIIESKIKSIKPHSKKFKQ